MIQPEDPDAACYAGLMSGTSLDGVDGVLARFAGSLSSGGRSTQRPVTVLAHAHRPFDPALRSELLALNSPGVDELHRAALAGNALAQVQADVVAELLRQAGLTSTQVRAVGSHGQTVRHRPGEFDGLGYTLQLNQPARLAELCGVDVVADFRSRDVAAGGQGAPLVPAFHARVFGDTVAQRAVLNIGGIANLTLLPWAGDPSLGLAGYDCGPGNALLDHWVARHRGQAWDAEGAWAASGQVLPDLLRHLMAEQFLHRSPPKSTGRDLFNPAWLAGQFLRAGAESGAWAPQDVQATLTEFTAAAAARSLREQRPGVTQLLVCGGGAYNRELMRRLSADLPGVEVLSTEAAGLPPLQVEAAAFAWLARAHLLRQPGQHPQVTGARGLRVLGAWYPAD